MAERPMEVDAVAARWQGPSAARAAPREINMRNARNRTGVRRKVKSLIKERLMSAPPTRCVSTGLVGVRLAEMTKYRERSGAPPGAAARGRAPALLWGKQAS